MFHKIFRNESYCLGISVLIIFMLYYIIICNKRINTVEKYNEESMPGMHYKALSDRRQNNIIKADMDAKNGWTHGIVDVFNSIVHKKEFLKQVIVHLDLKGAPPKISYLKNFLTLIKSFGATGILVEYEDMFPYHGKLKNLAALNAYSTNEIVELYSVAKEIGLEFIPLLQTFGHLEFMLKLEEFLDLREVPAYPQAICPTNNRTMVILKMMINQVIKLHPGIRYVHIGSDEVYNLGECKRCQEAIIKQYWAKDDLFLSHAAQVARYIKTSFHISPIMWDDELRKIPLDVIKKSGIEKIVEIMVWHYSPGIMEKIPTSVWNKYTAFNGIWMASAFKGAANPNSYITDIGKRVNNNKEWLESYQMLQPFPFKGITLTGWQRFDHFAVLCELLPQAIPSLALSIAYIKTNKMDHDTILRVGNTLGCDSFLNTDLEYLEYINDCTYPGAALLKVVQRLHMLKKDVQAMLDANFFTGWVSRYNIDHTFASPHYVEVALQDLSVLMFECKKLTDEARIAMVDIYDNLTIQEWLSLYLIPLQQQLNDLQEIKISLLTKNSWKRNPQLVINNKKKNI